MRARGPATAAIAPLADRHNYVQIRARAATDVSLVTTFRLDEVSVR